MSTAFQVFPSATSDSAAHLTSLTLYVEEMETSQEVLMKHVETECDSCTV